MSDLQHRLCALIAESAQLMHALRLARSLKLAEWCIGAGAIRNLVWDRPDTPASHPASDIDLVYFQHDPAPHQHEDALLAQLRRLDDRLPWEVTNQATVHLWRRNDNQIEAPLTSLLDGIASWPETATAVGATLLPDDTLRILAPFGLDDLFAGRLRRNAARVSSATFNERLAQKGFRERWPHVNVIP